MTTTSPADCWRCGSPFHDGGHCHRARPRWNGRNTRARGTNPRATGTNPRATGTNPSAGTDNDAGRVARLLRRAIARHRVTTGTAWCETCDDSGVVLVPNFDLRVERWGPCPAHRTMTTADAAHIMR